MNPKFKAGSTVWYWQPDNVTKPIKATIIGNLDYPRSTTELYPVYEIHLENNTYSIWVSENYLFSQEELELLNSITCV